MRKKMIHELAPQGKLMNAVRRLLIDESAQGLVEYALLITFTALVCLVGLRFLGAKANNTLANAANSLS
jgi:Flp pilus assembly pilin Flp